MLLYLGTTNPGKVREWASILAPLGVDIRTASLHVPETSDTFEGNARQKALAYAAHTGGVTVSEDSGLVVPWLGGLPGPWSARFDDCVLRDFPGTRVVEVRDPSRALDSVEGLLADERMQRAVAFIKKQPPEAHVTTRQSTHAKRRRR